MTPAYAAQAFLGGPKGPNGGSPRGLLDIDGWEAMSEGKAAQTVQVSAFPDAYDKWLPFAESLVDTVKGNAPMGGTNCEAQATTAVSAGQVAPSEAANVALAAAKAQIGVPYSWGGGNKDGKSKGIGKGANTVGFDCSGLTLFAYAQAGITLPRLSDDQIDIGTKVTKADLSPGDLVFWTGHVAMYVGDGKVIHAPRTGKNVAIVPVSQAHSGAPTGYSRPAGTAAAAPTTPAKA
jgi:cell wall-associated NlpC family hydrolase